MAHRYFQAAHPYYAGVDLHARTLYLHVCDPAGTPRIERELPAEPGPFLDAIKPFRPGLVVGVECMFAWYWLADLCERESIPFVLGHALAMRAIHGGKSKNDRLDAANLAGLLRSGYFPTAYVYPKEKRDTRDLLRRRSVFVRRRAQLITHLQLLNAQYNLPPFTKKLTYKGNRSATLAGRKMGNAHLKWAFSEAASLMLRSFEPAKKWMAKQSRKRGVKKAHAILESKIGRTVYHLWKSRQAFDAKKFLAS